MDGVILQDAFPVPDEEVRRKYYMSTTAIDGSYSIFPFRSLKYAEDITMWHLPLAPFVCGVVEKVPVMIGVGDILILGYNRESARPLYQGLKFRLQGVSLCHQVVHVTLVLLGDFLEGHSRYYHTKITFCKVNINSLNGALKDINKVILFYNYIKIYLYKIKAE